MKKLSKMVVLTAITFFVCSCGNSGGQSSDNTNVDDNNNSEETEVVDEVDNHFSYWLLGRHEYSRGPGLSLCNNSSFQGHFIDWIGDYNYSFDGLVICYDNEPLLFDDGEDYYNSFIYDWALAIATACNLYKAEIKVVRPFETIWFVDEQRQVVSPEGDTMIVQKDGYYVVYNNSDTIYTFVETMSNNPYSTNYSILDKNGNEIQKGDTLMSWEFANGRTAEYILPYLNEYVGCLPECINGCQNEEIREFFLKTYYDIQEMRIFEPRKGYGYRTYPIEGYKYYDKYGQKCGSISLFRIKGGKYPNIPDGALGIWFGGAPTDLFWNH